MNHSSPIEKSVVLVGAGNAHLVFVKRWGMRPMPGVAVTLVNEAAVVPYSAMVPAHLAGEYSWERCCQRHEEAYETAMEIWEAAHQ